ncbi:MAG: DUF86 domain-containing protein [Anaerolineaceae bacterium]|nr:DUF86 domain-containing protein [Anaerolineaceae bacterium]
MSRRDPKIVLKQILAYSREAVEFAHNRVREDLDQDRMLNLALVRLIEIIGEAANHVPREYQSQYPEIPWIQMIGARNRLIHGYDNIDFDILWVILNEDLPDMIENLEKILGAE